MPPGPPHTKPKALDFALPLARGEFAVIYDAEDIPAPRQLHSVAAHFIHRPEISCIQAELATENAEESWLSALFAAEYSGLFGILLPALSRWRFPMPLGGTSNHFRVSALRQIGGWDAFNVTEDADIGVRLSRLRLRATTLLVPTSEEAPVSLRSWFGQRTRWMKGWMQTFLVHNRHPIRLLHDLGWRNFLAFQIHAGGIILTPPLHTLFTVALVARFASGADVFSSNNRLWVFLQILIFFAGNLSAIGLSVAGVQRLGNRRLYKFQFLIPVYWALMGFAAIRASWDLLARVHFWQKTVHGLTRHRRKRITGPTKRRERAPGSDVNWQKNFGRRSGIKSSPQA